MEQEIIVGAQSTSCHACNSSAMVRQVIDDGWRFRFGPVSSHGGKTGKLVFREAPDFNNPQDANGDNVHEFAFTTVGDTGSTTLDVTAVTEGASGG